MQKIWAFINFMNLILIIMVLAYSKEIGNMLNYYREYLNEVEVPDYMVLIRFFLNRWEGITIGLNLMFVFFARKLFSLFSGAVNKIAK